MEQPALPEPQQTYSYFRWSCWGLFLRPSCPLCINFPTCKSALKVFTSSHLPRMGNTSSVFLLSVLSPSPGKQRMMLAGSWQRESKQKHRHYEAELQVLQTCETLSFSKYYKPKQVTMRGRRKPTPKKVLEDVSFAFPYPKCC